MSAFWFGYLFSIMLANVPLNSKWSRIIETIHLNLKNIYYLKIWCLFCQILKAPNIIEGHRFPANKLFDDKWSTINRTWHSLWSSWDQTIEKWYWHWKPDLDKLSGRFMWPKLFLIVLKTDFNAMLLFLKFVSFLKMSIVFGYKFPIGSICSTIYRHTFSTENCSHSVKAIESN